MSELISYFRGTFIHEKQILDGVFIANKCVDSRLKANKPEIMCNIDTEKAFDNVRFCENTTMVIGGLLGLDGVLLLYWSITVRLRSLNQSKD